MRNWIKSIIFECLNEIIKDRPLIISNRPPTENDIYSVGTHWNSGADKYIATNCKVDWIKVDENPAA